jgi:hypothetical protein
LFSSLLAACVPAGSVRSFTQGGGTRVATYLAGLPASATPIARRSFLRPRTSTRANPRSSCAPHRVEHNLTGRLRVRRPSCGR